MVKTGALRAAAPAAALWAATAWAAPVHRPLLGIVAEERFDDGLVHEGRKDLMTKLSPEVGYELKTELRSLSAAYAADLTYHLAAGNVSVDHRGRLSYKDAPLERLKLHADGSIYRVEDSTTLPRFGVARTLSAALWLQGQAGLEILLSPRDTAALAYSAEATRLYAGGLPLSTVQSLSPELKRRVTPRLELGLRYRAQLFTAGALGSAHAHALSGALRYVIARHMFLAADAGPALFFAGGAGGKVVPRFGAQLGYEARGLEVGILGGRDFVGAAGYAAAIWADTVQAAAAWKVNRAWSLDAGAGLYRNGLAPSGPSDAKGWGAGVGVEWRFARGFFAGASYNRISQIGTAPAAGLSRNIASARVGYRMP